MPESLLANLSEFISARLGLNFPEERWNDLRDGIEVAAKEFQFKNTESCIRWFLSSSPSKAQLETLAACFTVGETYFFRQIRQFEILEEKIIPEIIQARQNERRLRIWSAGCCTGEEPYSLAMLLDKFASELAGWHVSILATDVNAKFLRKAEAGVYGDWSFREVPQWVKEKYFRKLPQGKLEILPRLKEAVTFSLLNLAEDAYPSLLNGTNAMDVIFCRNVLMYFHPDRAADVIASLKLCLGDSGCLFVSPSEVSQTAFSRFEALRYPDVTVYRQGRASSLESHVVQREAEPGRKATVPGEYVGLASFELLGADAAAIRDPQSLIVLARTLANQGRLVEALKRCDEAIALNKLDASTHYLKGAILQEQGLMGDAAASLRRALYLDADFVLAHFALGNLAHRGRRADEAKRHFKNAAAVLAAYEVERILPDTDGLTAGRLSEIAASALNLIGESI